VKRQPLTICSRVGCSSISRSKFRVTRPLPRPVSASGVKHSRVNVSITLRIPGDQVTPSFIWRNGHLKDLGSLGGSNVYVHTINDQGVAADYSDIPPGTPIFGHPVIWKNDRIIDMGAPAPGFNCAAGDSVNSHEQVVGGAGCNQDGLGYPFLWEKSNPIVDLNSLLEPGTNLQIDLAASINDRGEIAAECETPTGEARACLLAPLDDEHEWSDEATAWTEGSAVTKARPSSRRIDPRRAREGKSLMLLQHGKAGSASH
jgi:hypothetical protein